MAIPSVPDDITALPLLEVELKTVVAANHPLAALNRPVTTTDLEHFVQLVLSDPVAPDGPSYGIAGGGQWRFVDLARRLDFLLAGFGWCRMPSHLVNNHVREGRLVDLNISSELSRTPNILTIFAAHMKAKTLGIAGHWLLDDLASRPCP